MNIKMTHSGLVSKIPQLIGFAEVSSESHNRPEATSLGAFARHSLCCWQEMKTLGKKVGSCRSRYNPELLGKTSRCKPAGSGDALRVS